MQVSSADRCCWVRCDSCVLKALSSNNNRRSHIWVDLVGNIDKYEVVSTLAQIFLFRFISACLQEPISGQIISPRILLFTQATALWRYCAYGRHHISWTRVFSPCKHRLVTVPQNRRLQNILGDAEVSCYQIKWIEFTQYPELQQKFNFTRAPFFKNNFGYVACVDCRRDSSNYSAHDVSRNFSFGGEMRHNMLSVRHTELS